MARELAGEEIRLAAEVDLLQEMVEGQKEHDREARLFEDGRLQDAHAEVDRCGRRELARRKEEEEAQPGACSSRCLRAEQHRAAAEELVARLEAELAERAGRRRTTRRRTGEEWRSTTSTTRTESRCFEDPRQAAWSGLPQDLREVPKDEAVEALRSLVRAAAGPELKFGRGGDDGGGVGGGNDLGGGLGEEAVQGLRPGRRIVGLGVFGVL